MILSSDLALIFLQKSASIPGRMVGDRPVDTRPRPASWWVRGLLVLLFAAVGGALGWFYTGMVHDPVYREYQFRRMGSRRFARRIETAHELLLRVGIDSPSKGALVGAVIGAVDAVGFLVWYRARRRP